VSADSAVMPAAKRANPMPFNVMVRERMEDSHAIRPRPIETQSTPSAFATLGRSPKRGMAARTRTTGMRPRING
jgi:hypothetical protein